MVKYTELGLDTVKYTDSDNNSTQMSIVPIITLADSAFEKVKKEKQKERIWSTFYNKMSKTLDYADDLKVNKEDDKEPFSNLDDNQYFFTTLMSISGLRTNQRKDVNIGLRYVVEDEVGDPIVKTFDSQFVKHLDADNVDQNIDIDDLQDVHGQILKELKRESKNNVQAYEEKEEKRREQEEQERREREEQERREREEQEMQNSNSNVQEQQYVDNNQYVDDAPIQEVYEQPAPPRDKSEELKDDLFDAIDAKIPLTTLEGVEIDYDGNYDDEDEPTYARIERVGLNSVAQYQNERFALAQTKRDEIVNRIFQEALPEFWSYYNENQRLLNYESKDSLFNSEFENIESKYKEVIDSLPNQRTTKFDELTKQFEEDKKRRGELAKQREMERIEAEERPLVEQRVEEFINNITDEATEEYNEQIDVLEADVQNAYTIKNYEIVDKIMEKFNDKINNETKKVDAEREKMVSAVNQKHAEKTNDIQQQITDLELKRADERNRNEERVNLEVERRIVGYKEQEQRLNETLKELEMLKENKKEADERIKNLEIEKNYANERAKRAEEKEDEYKARYDEQLKRNFKADEDNLERSRTYSSMAANSHNSKFGNFNGVVAPYNDGEGNSMTNEGVTEKVAPSMVAAPLMNNSTVSKYPYSAKNDPQKNNHVVYGLGLGTLAICASILGTSLYGNQQEEQMNKEKEETTQQATQQDNAKDAKTFKKGDRVVVDTGKKGNERLQPAEVTETKGSSVIVKTPDGELYKLK